MKKMGTISVNLLLYQIMIPIILSVKPCCSMFKSKGTINWASHMKRKVSIKRSYQNSILCHWWLLKRTFELVTMNYCWSMWCKTKLTIVENSWSVQTVVTKSQQICSICNWQMQRLQAFAIIYTSNSLSYNKSIQIN